MTAPLTPPRPVGQIVFNDHPGRPTVAMVGEIDLTVTEAIGDDAVGQHHQPGHAFTVDLGSVTFMDSSGLGVLMRLHNVEPGIELVNVPPRVRLLLTRAGLSDVLQLDEAD